MKKTFLYILVFIIVNLSFSLEVKGQDYILSQPYNNAITIAPSFAGFSNGGHAALTYRNQWPSINEFKAYNTSVFGFDYFIKRYNSGVGGLISSDVQGNGLVKSIDVALQYSYRIQLNRNLFLTPGVQFKYIHKALDYSKYVFSENISVDGIIIDYKTPFDVEFESYNKLDASVSALLFNEHFWAGFNVDHLIPSNSSFLNEDGRIPIRYSVMGGYNLVYRSNNYRNYYDDAITIATLLQHQGQFNQMDIGATWTKSAFQLGLWYRGFILPVSTVTSRDALICVVGLSLENFKVSYSYDISLSSLSDTSGGAHEISLQFFFDRKEKSPMSFFCR